MSRITVISEKNFRVEVDVSMYGSAEALKDESESTKAYPLSQIDRTELSLVEQGV